MKNVRIAFVLATGLALFTTGALAEEPETIEVTKTSKGASVNKDGTFKGDIKVGDKLNEGNLRRHIICFCDVL